MEPPKPAPESNPEQPTEANPGMTPTTPTPFNTPAAGETPATNPTPTTGFGSGAWQSTGNDSTQLPPVNTDIPSIATVAGNKKRRVVPVLVATALLVVLGGGYTFAFYLPTRPGAIFSSSLDRTGKAVDSLIAYGGGVAAKNYKSSTFSGTLQVKSSAVSFDASLDGAYDEDANATATLNADVLGEKVGVNLRSVHEADNTSPDVYLQVSGIKPTLDSLGMNSLDTLDGQWISVDHTLIDTIAANAAEQSAGSSLTSAAFPTSAQLEDAAAKIQAVNKKYIFTTDSKTAVLEQSKYVGKETKDGRSTYHYKVGYTKTNLQAYVNALGTALNGSSLNTWAKASNDGKNLSTSLQSLHASINRAKSDYTFDVWVDTETKLIHSLQFVDPSDQSVMTLSQNYTGGDVYPFVLSVNGKDSATGETSTMTMDLSVDTKTNKDSGKLVFSSGSSSGTLKFSITPSNDPVKVTAPTGAQSVINVLSQLGLGDSGF
jgi:hypothetical protein